jgi:hypothetical protein
MALRQGQPPNTCFYSNKCEWSEAFLKELSTTNYKREFQFVCIDTTPRGQLPGWLKQVPTLVIKDDQEPIKTNSDVMNWLYERKLKDVSRSPAVTSYGSNSGGRAPSGGPSGGSGSSQDAGEPEAWNISEMGGKLSESYGNLVDGSGASVENSGMKNFDFGFLNGNASPGDRTTQGMGDSGMRQEPSRSKSKKEELFDRQMDAYQKSRDVGLPQVRPRQSSNRQ